MGRNKQSGFGTILGLGIGLAAGWGLRKLLQKKYDETIGLFRNPVSEKELITTVFGEYTKEASGFYEQVQQELMDQISQLKTSLSEIDTKKYRELVDDALKKIQRDQEIPQKQVKALREYLMDDFAQIKVKAKKQSAKTGAKRTVKKAEKVMKSAAEKVQE